MMKVNYGIKVELGPSGQPMYSVRKNDYPMSIHVVDMKTASAVVELLCQEYNAGYCDGGDHVRYNTIKQEPTQDEVEQYLAARGMRVTADTIDKTTRIPPPDHFLEANITPRLHDMAEAFYRNECGLDDEQVSKRLLTVMYDVHDGEAMRVGLAAHLFGYKQRQEPDHESPYSLGDIVRQHMAENFEGEELDEVTEALNEFYGQDHNTEQSEEAASEGVDWFGQERDRSPGDEYSLHLFDHVPCCGLPTIDGDEVKRRIKVMCPPDTSITHCGDKPLCMDSGYDDELEADPLNRGGDYVPPPCCEFDSNGDEILKDVVPRSIDAVSRDYEKIITQIANDDPLIGSLCVTRVDSTDEMIRHGWEPFQKPFNDGIEQMFVKRVDVGESPATLDDIDKLAVAQQDPNVVKSIVIPNECLVIYLSNNWEFYDRFDDKQAVVVLYESPHNG